MSEQPQKPSLSLVSSFYASDYAYPFRHQYQDHLSAQERTTVLAALTGAIKTALIDDYHIEDGEYAVTVHLKNAKDFVKFNLAGYEEGEMPFDFFLYKDEYSTEDIENICDELQDFSDGAGFEDRVMFDYDSEEKRVFAIAVDKRSYFEFIKIAEEQKLHEKYAHFQREEDAFELAEPTIDDMTLDQSDLAAPTYERFIRGGKTDGAASEQKASPSSLHLVKDISDSAYPYYAHFPIPDQLTDLRDARDHIKGHLLGKLQTINALDYKLIENAHDFELRLKHAVDEVHFRVAYNSAPDMPMRTTFALPENKRKHISEVSKLRKRFKQAVASAQQDDAVQVKLDPAEKVVVVTADNVSNYFSFWRQISPAALRSLLNPAYTP